MNFLAQSHAHRFHPHRLAVATSNAGKLRELAALIGISAPLQPAAELGLALPEETGRSFEDNARAKASFVATSTGMLTIADDSGLEVDVLNGAPGVDTARYAGPNATDGDNRTLLLKRLEGIPPGQRSARFVCVIAVVDAYGNSTVATGKCDGLIAMQEIGSGGFGYDPIFELEDGRTMAELTATEKNEISHRGVALRKILPILRSSLAGGKLLLEPGGGT